MIVGNPNPPLSAEEEAHILAWKADALKVLRLLNSGPGGVAQVRKMFREHVGKLDDQLRYRPRVRDLAEKVPA